MSAASHETVARQHEEKGEAHQALYDPAAKKSYLRCSGEDGHQCWTSTRNPTEAHQVEAERYRRAAADHRAASSALREAETKTCAGIAPEERDASPFTHVEDIANVELIVLDRVGQTVTRRRAPVEHRGEPGYSAGHVVGAVVTFRTVPGLTAEILQRLVDCHLARNAALGHVAPEMPNCPLVPRGVEARVIATGSGLEVELRASDNGSAREVLARAQRLVGPGNASRESRSVP
jgi:hypothetical protein